MRSWLILAWKEFWLPFYYRKPGGCPGGRNFVWLTTFMALLLTLILLLFASQEGLLNRFVDVLLGNTPGYGVPISVTTNMFSKGGINGINKVVLQAVEQLGVKNDTGQEPGINGLKIFPYRPVEASLRPLIALPGEGIWQNRQSNGSKFGPDFDGWAVYPDNPLWDLPFDEDEPEFPLKIILSRSLFVKYFNYQQYRKALQVILPAKYFKSLPVDQNAPLSMLWLQVTNGRRRELLPFKVSWIERFPVIDKIAYVFPLKTYHALNAAFHFPELRYYPEFQGKSGERTKEILIEMNQTSPDKEKQKGYAEVIAKMGGGDVSNYRGDVRFTFTSPVWQSWITTYMEQFQWSYRINETVSGDVLKHDRDALLLPCNRLPDDQLQGIACDSESPQLVRLEVTGRGNGFQHALIYVPDRTLLTLAVNELEQVNNHALSIHPLYQDALNRFGFLSRTLEAMKTPYFWFLGILLCSFLSIQIGAMIGHHRQRYGMFLAKGMEWWQIYCMLWFQIVLAHILGFLVALLSIEGIRYFLQAVIRKVASEYIDTLSLADLNLLPLAMKDYCLAGFLVLLLAWLLATIFLYRMPLRPRTHPAALLH